MFQQHNNGWKQSTVKHWAFSVRLGICFHLKRGLSISSFFFRSHKTDPLDFLSQISNKKSNEKETKIQTRPGFESCCVPVLNCWYFHSDHSRKAQGLVQGLLLSVGLFESALHVLNWGVACSAHTVCLAKQPFLGAYTFNTDGLSCEVWDNSREDMTLLKMSIWTNPSLGWPTDQKKALRENIAKRCGKLLPLQWGTGHVALSTN